MCKLSPQTVDAVSTRGRIYEVGGAVRDRFLKPDLVVKDRDYLVTGVPYDELTAILRRHGRVDLVGRSFGVIKFTQTVNDQTYTFDITLPRREHSTGVGHKDFAVNFDPNLYRVGSEFVYVTFPQSRSGEWPTLHFGLPGFNNGILDVQQIIDGKDAKVAEIDAAARRISVKRPVTLTTLGQVFANVEYKDAAPLQPIEISAGPK